MKAVKAVVRLLQALDLRNSIASASTGGKPSGC